MKKSQLYRIIKEELRALKEDTNPELDNLVRSFVEGLAKRNGYQQSDAVMAIFEAMKRLGFIDKNADYKAADALSEVGPAYRVASFTKTMTPETNELYSEYVRKIDMQDPSALNTHEELKKALESDPRYQENNQQFLLQTALGWAMTFAQEMER